MRREGIVDRLARFPLAVATRVFRAVRLVRRRRALPPRLGDDGRLAGLVRPLGPRRRGPGDRLALGRGPRPDLDLDPATGALGRRRVRLVAAGGEGDGPGSEAVVGAVPDQGGLALASRGGSGALRDASKGIQGLRRRSSRAGGGTLPRGSRHGDADCLFFFWFGRCWSASRQVKTGRTGWRSKQGRAGRKPAGTNKKDVSSQAAMLEVGDAGADWTTLPRR
ncbi:hypothetical protein CDD83_2008 [Cordyceps sp. RAO-2017]|nr:hypothetical protein CDD83_2008 [Cordyceps sp. RAO-2017]